MTAQKNARLAALIAARDSRLAAAPTYYSQMDREIDEEIAALTKETPMTTKQAAQKNAAALLAQLDSMPTKTLQTLHGTLLGETTSRNTVSLRSKLRKALEALAGDKGEQAEAPAAKTAEQQVGERLSKRLADRAAPSRPLAEQPAVPRVRLAGPKSRGAKIAQAQAAVTETGNAADPDIQRALAEERAILAAREADRARTEADVAAAAVRIDEARARAQAAGEPALGPAPVSLRALINAALAEAVAGAAGGPAAETLYSAAKKIVEEHAAMAAQLAAGKPARAPRAPRPAKEPAAPKARDPRLPPVGTVLTRETRSHGTCVVVVEAEGIRYAGELYGSLSKAASVHMGVNQNGYTFFAKALAET